MRTVLALMDRNRKLFFKDKGMLFTSMITPVILIVLYATFLAKVFRDSFTAAISDMIMISDKLINGTVAAQLTASLMAVSCITVTFCVNLTMVQDKANGTRKDFNVAPVSKEKIYLGYFLSTVANSLMVNALAFVLCLGYLLKMGWYMNTADILWVLFDMILLVLFGSFRLWVPLSVQDMVFYVVLICRFQILDQVFRRHCLIFRVHMPLH